MKREIKTKTNKKGQEEMVGFALILIILSVLILVFLSISIKNKGTVEESYVTDNFVQALLQHTTNCSSSGNYLDIQDLTKKCSSSGNYFCEDTTTTYCEYLNDTISELLNLSWSVGEGNETYYKGYSFEIMDSEEPETPILEIKKGNETHNFKGSTQHLEKIDITLRLYV